MLQTMTREMSLQKYLHNLFCSKSQKSKNLLEIWLGLRSCLRLLKAASAETHGVTSAVGQYAENNIIMCMWACINLHKPPLII